MIDGSSEVRDVCKVERKGVHSHITGLGLREDFEVLKIGNGMVGQEKARRAAGLIVQMVKKSRIAGRAVLITGEPGTGKTAIAVGISKSIGADTPFVSISASEIFSRGVGKTEALYQALRRAMGVRIREETEVLEGEVVRIDTVCSTGGGSGKSGKLTLKTLDMESDFSIGVRMVDPLTKEHVQVGDIIQVDKANGRVTKLGRSIARTSDYDACGPAVKAVPCPNGEILKRVDKSHVVSLHEMDVINSRSHGVLAVFSGDTGEIANEVREQINKKVTEWQDENKAEIVPGVLFIDEVHMLDLECFSFLNRAIESDLSPIVIMATNKGETKIRGSEVTSPHGIPIDLLDRCLIVRTRAYTDEECKEILRIRATDEGVHVDEAAMVVLASITTRTSLRYAAMLISLAEVVRQRRNGETVEKEDLAKVYKLFFDKGRVEAKIAKYRGDFISG